MNTNPEVLESPRAEPDFAAMDDLADFGVAHAAELEANSREIGEQMALLCLEKAERDCDFDSAGAQRFIHGWVIRHGDTSGEDLVDAAMEHGYRGHDMRCFGSVFGALVRQQKLRVLRSDLPRKRGHGTSGGKLYGLVR